MAKRRGWGEDSVYQRADGTWVAVMEAGRAEGTRKRIVRKAQTKREAVARLDEAKRTMFDAGSVPDQRRTVEQYLRFWLSEVVPGTVRDSTLEGYRSMVDAYLVPHLGSVRLVKLGPEHVQRMLRSMEAKGLSPWTRRQARSVLVGALRRAQRFGYVTRNAAALVDAPRIDQSDQVDDTLSADEVRRLLAHLHDSGDELVAVAEVAIRLGLRRGEILALRWTDVDLEAGTLRVGGTLKRRKGGGWYIDEPKTKAGDRVVPLTDHLVAELRAHRRRQLEARLSAGDSWQDLRFVFTTSVGTPIDARNLTRWWHGIFEVDEDQAEEDRLGLAARPFHSTRRTAVTLMAEAGVPLQVAANIVGHSSIRMTAEVYNRVQPRAQRSALDALEDHLAGG